MQAVPYGQNTLGLYVNKSAFDRAGITELPTTFEEYKKAAEIFTQQDPNAYMIVSPTSVSQQSTICSRRQGRANLQKI